MVIRRSTYSKMYTILLLVATLMIICYSKAQSEHPHLPPRPQPIQPTSEPNNFAASKAGAWIVMYAIPSVAGLWTGVQWVDGEGNWHDVAGWQGAFNHPDHIAWFVEQKDFGKGPFRWIVYQRQGGKPLTTSQAFYLPTHENEIVRIEVTLSDMWSSY